jgi:kynureninase
MVAGKRRVEPPGGAGVDADRFRTDAHDPGLLGQPVGAFGGDPGAPRDPVPPHWRTELELAKGITRFQAGTPLVLPHYVASAGWEILEAVGLDRIRRSSLALTDAVIDHADALGLQVATPREHGQRAGVVCLRFPEAEQVAAALNARRFFCSYRPASGLRIGPHFYNTIEEIDRFMAALASERGPGRR